MVDMVENTGDNRLDRQRDRIILIPYADKDGANTGVNINSDDKRVDIYLKNCCVALISAKHYNSDCDVALVTNIDVPEKYNKLLSANNIKIIKTPFDEFTFGDKYLWNLAFYKLCAVDYVVKNFDYNYVSYMDSDVVIQSSFNDIWEECDYSVLLYDINHGLQVKDYRIIVDEFSAFLGEKSLITHYGGEFFAANRDNAEIFIDKCKDIYRTMIEKGFTTTKGDEFIISLAASQMKEKIKNAGAYIYRFWTSGFRLVSTCYAFNPVTILHMPAEKEHGMLVLYNRFIRKNKMPKKKTVWRICHLKNMRFSAKVKSLLRTILKK